MFLKAVKHARAQSFFYALFESISLSIVVSIKNNLIMFAFGVGFVSFPPLLYRSNIGGNYVPHTTTNFRRSNIRQIFDLFCVTDAGSCRGIF
jgi:hypothetical protein